MILAVASQKGGVGKTTTSISIAAGLARAGQKVLLIDIDSQANSSKVLHPKYSDVNSGNSICNSILEKGKLPITPSRIDGLDIVPSHIYLSGADIRLTTAIDHREARLKEQIDKVKDAYDHIIIDCPPALSWLTLNAFTAANDVLIVTSPGYFELDSIVQIQQTITEVKQNFNPDLNIRGILFTMSEPTKNTKMSKTILLQTYGDLVFKAKIPKNVALKDASLAKVDIFAYEPESKAGQAYRKLINEIFNINVPS